MTNYIEIQNDMAKRIIDLEEYLHKSFSFADIYNRNRYVDGIRMGKMNELIYLKSLYDSLKSLNVEPKQRPMFPFTVSMLEEYERNKLNNPQVCVNKRHISTLRRNTNHNVIYINFP